MAHRLGDQVLGLLPGIHRHLRVRREVHDLYADRVRVRRRVVQHDQHRRLAGAHEVARHAVDEVAGRAVAGVQIGVDDRHRDGVPSGSAVPCRIRSSPWCRPIIAQMRASRSRITARRLARCGRPCSLALAMPSTLPKRCSSSSTTHSNSAAATRRPTASHWIAPVIVSGIPCDGDRRSPAMDAGRKLFGIYSSLLLLYSWCACSGMSRL